MSRKKLAEKLVAAKSAAEIKQILTVNKKFADEELALALKDICYAAWTSEPTKAQKTARILKELNRLTGLKEIDAIFAWVSGVAHITKGKLEHAIKDLDRSAEILKELDREHEAAQTQVPKLIAFALLGRYEEAVTTGEGILKILDKHGDEVTAGKIEKNLGNILSRQDLHLRAEEYYLAARQRFIKCGEKSEQIMAENGLAITYMQLNDFRKAEKFFSEALRNASEEKMLLTEAEIEASMGNLAIFRGRYNEALQYLERSRRKYEELQMPHQTAVAKLEIADIYRELNLNDEAFEIYREVSDELGKLKLQGEEARARANFGRVAAASDQIQLARRELKKAARLYERENNSNGAAAVWAVQARIEADQGNFDEALKIIGKAEKALRTSESFRDKLDIKWLKADALYKSGSYAKSEKILSGILVEAEKQQQPNIALAALNSLGKCALAKRNFADAKRYFKKAIALIEKLRAPLAAEEFRMAFLSNKLEPFENLAAICIKEFRIKEAFSYVEAARSRALADVLGTSENLVTAKDSAGLTAELDRLREELNWCYSCLNRAEVKDLARLQHDAKQKEKQISVLMRRIESTNENRNFRRDTFDSGKLQKQLGKKKLLIEFVNLDGVFSAIVVDDKDIRYVENLASENEIMELLEGLQFQFGALRYGKKLPEIYLAELKKRANFYLQKLYEKLLAPIAAYFGQRDLVIVPVGALYYVAFPALYDGEKYVVEDREIAHSPSAAIWQALDQKRWKEPKGVLLMGYADEKIPLVNDEIGELITVFPAAESFTGDEASFAAFTENAPKCDLLHMACHGQFRPENPLFSSLHLADGWVTVRDICRQKLRAQLVTLSACETGLNKIFAGDEIIGLARGFLSAGANSLVLSLWTVNDQATATLMKNFYRNLRQGHSVSASLQTAQKEFIRKSEHPYFWSSFVLLGK